jgi:DNA polymerase-3 subunit epsilon
MNLTRPLVFLDVESTGPEPATDRIVELAMMEIIHETVLIGSPETFHRFYNPGFEMNEEVIAVHGITNAQVKDFPPLDERAAAEIHAFLIGADICGYGVHNFDLTIIWEELYRRGIEWNLAAVHVIDCANIFKKKEPRDLTAALKFYFGEDHADAHSAMADITATDKVLAGQIKRYDDLAGMDVAALAKFSHMDERVDIAGLIIRDKQGRPCFNTKRNRGVPIVADVSYAEWIMGKDFPTQTKIMLRKIIDEYYQKLSNGDGADQDDEEQEQLL